MYLVKFELLSRMPVPGSEKLYYRLSGGATCVDDEIRLPAGGAVTLDTFFNLFSCKHFKYAHTDNLSVRVEFSGDISVELRLTTFGKDELLIKRGFRSADKTFAEIAVPERNYDEGYLYVKISAAGKSVFYGGGFHVVADARRVKIGVVVCTYHREEFLKRNMRLIGEYMSYDPSFNERADFIVVDNGKTLTKEELPDFVNLIPNENTGGTGGFTRGLKEVLAAPEAYTHFLFMDDDIVFMPSVIDRTFALLSLMKEEYFSACIGGAMLRLTEPCIQHEFGGRWLGNILKGNLKDINMAAKSGLLENERELCADYNAWWYMCLPVHAAEKNGLPLEMFFIKGDDVEYGLRAADGVINLTGIGVWHESFDYKFNPMIEYFVKRNELIVNARFPRGKGFVSNWFKMVRSISKALVEFRYFHIDMIAAAYLDYLKGADYLKKRNYSEFIEKAPKSLPKMLGADEVAAKYGLDLDAELGKSKAEKTRKFIETVTLNGYLIPSAFYRGVGVADMVYPKPVNFFKRREIVNYNPYTRQAFVSSMKKSKLFYGLGKIIRITFEMIFRYRKAKKSYGIDVLN